MNVILKICNFIFFLFNNVKMLDIEDILLSSSYHLKISTYRDLGVIS